MPKRWPELWNLCEEGIIKEIDYFFAEKIYPQANLVEAAFLSALMGHSREGNICLQPDAFTSIDKQYEEWVRQGSQMTALPEAVSLHDSHYYLKRNLFFETRFIEEIKRLSAILPSPEIVIGDDVSSEQRQAIEKACSHSLSLIVGGPGVGKTHVARKLAAAFGAKGKVILTAPTGKAASRLGGQTLHSLLKIYSPNHFFQEGEWIDADLIIVDESSMIDIRLFSYLLASISPRTRVVLMGDSDQLPPVESGSVFADLVEAACIPCTHLTQVFRTDRIEILDLAKSIRLGDQDAVIRRLTPIDIWKDALAHFPHPQKQIPDPSELLKACDAFRILSCIRKGPQGVDTLNEAIARYFIERRSLDERLPIPILITRSDSSQGLSNGDTGVLLYGEDIAYFPAKDKEIRALPRSSLPAYEYAYCLSVHKSQGSEYDKVLLLVPDGSEVFGREALYTAVTRAKSSVAIDGDETIIRTAIAKSSRKTSNVCRRLKC